MTLGGWKGGNLSERRGYRCGRDYYEFREEVGDLGGPFSLGIKKGIRRAGQFDLSLGFRNTFFVSGRTSLGGTKRPFWRRVQIRGAMGKKGGGGKNHWVYEE